MRDRSQILRHANAELGARRMEVLAEQRNFGIAAAVIDADGLGLPRAGFEHDTMETEPSGFRFQLGQDQPADAAVPSDRCYVHSFDLANAGLNSPQRAAASGS